MSMVDALQCTFASTPVGTYSLQRNKSVSIIRNSSSQRLNLFLTISYLHMKLGMHATDRQKGLFRGLEVGVGLRGVEIFDV